jgi:hypothetical protein
MANSYVNNPIVLDTFSSTVDIALQAFGLAKAPVMIKKVVFTDPTAADIVILRDASNNIVVAMEAVTTNLDVQQDFCKGFKCQGLTLTSTDVTVTTGKVLIYV